MRQLFYIHSARIMTNTIFSENAFEKTPKYYKLEVILNSNYSYEEKTIKRCLHYDPVSD